MDTISNKVYQELIKDSVWDKTYEKMMAREKGAFSNAFDLLVLKSSDDRYTKAQQICDGSYEWSIPEKVMLAKSGTTKKRTVYLYSETDRFLLGVLYRTLNNAYGHLIAPNCFSYRSGVSTRTAITYIDNKKKTTNMYGLKLDISAYFNSVSREHLNNCLTELFGVDTGIRKTMDKLFANDDITYKGVNGQEYKALIPGCALGSFFADYCLKSIDEYFLDKQVIYARYSDDIILLDESREVINEHLDYIKARLSEYGLSINEKKYVHFNPDESVEYLGLALSNDGVDISEHAKKKLKKTIKRWVKAGRKDIEMNHKDFEKVARNIVNRLNWKLYKSYILDERKFGWAYYAFRYITVLDSMTEIDFYLRDRLRYLKTGKNNKMNVKALNDEDFRKLGVLSLYDMYQLFHEDFDYYCEVAYLI